MAQFLWDEPYGRDADAARVKSVILGCVEEAKTHDGQLAITGSWDGRRTGRIARSEFAVVGPLRAV